MITTTTFQTSVVESDSNEADYVLPHIESEPLFMRPAEAQQANASIAYSSTAPSVAIAPTEAASKSKKNNDARLPLTRIFANEKVSFN